MYIFCVQETLSFKSKYIWSKLRSFFSLFFVIIIIIICASCTVSILKFSTRFEAWMRFWWVENFWSCWFLSNRFYYIWAQIANNLLLLLLLLLFVWWTEFSHNKRKYFVTPSRCGLKLQSIQTEAETTTITQPLQQKLTINNRKRRRKKIIKTKIDTRSHEKIVHSLKHTHTHARSFTWNIVYGFTATFNSFWIFFKNFKNGLTVYVYLYIEMRYFRLGSKNKCAQIFQCLSKKDLSEPASHWLLAQFLPNCLIGIQITHFDANLSEGERERERGNWREWGIRREMWIRGEREWRIDQVFTCCCSCYYSVIRVF